MNGVLGYTGPGAIWANEMNFGMHHAPGAGLTVQPFDLQSSVQIKQNNVLKNLNE